LTAHSKAASYRSFPVHDLAECEDRIVYMFSFISHNPYFFFIFKGHHNNRKNKEQFFRRKRHMKNSMTVIFENEAEAYKALSDFRRDPLNGDYAIANAAVVKRNGESLSVMDGFEMPVGMNNSSKGWIIGMITGIFFGFYAMFMGACLGCLIGVFFDHKELKKNSGYMQEASKQLPEDTTALVMVVNEKTAGMIDARLAHYETEIIRTPILSEKELKAQNGELHTTY
jgi:uncharacterized membrane protein